MSFLNKSIEDSLKLINTSDSDVAPKPQVAKRKRGRPRKKIANTSPVRVPQMSPVNKFSPFRTTSRPSSPITLQRTPEAQDHIVQPVSPIAVESEEDDVNSETEDDNKDLKETKDITSVLKSNYFNVVRYIENNGTLLYAVTYDLNGQVVYIELDGDDTSSVTGYQTIEYQRTEYIDYPFPLKEYYKNKLNGQLYGVVLTRGENMCLLTKTDNGDVSETYYGNNDENGNIDCYCVYKFSDIEEDLEASLQAISYTYEMIQQHQLMINKDTFKVAMEEINKIYVYSQEFDKIYKKFTQNILDDWSRFSNVSIDYMDKFFEEGLSEEESKKFNHISNNLFARFQAFNKITNCISELKLVPSELLSVKTKLKEIIDVFEKDDNKLSSKILDSNEIDVSI